VSAARARQTVRAPGAKHFARNGVNRLSVVDVEEINPALAQALSYARRGWKVFPCVAGTKKPMTAHGFKDSTADTLTIKRWWSGRIVPNVAIATGQPSGLFVIDGDTHKPGCEFNQLDPLPRTYAVTTASGGRHFYFRLPRGMTIKSAHDRLGRFVDVKGDGGYVVAPPSVFAGGVYRVERDSPLASPPDWLLGLLSSPNTQRLKAKNPPLHDSSDSVTLYAPPVSLSEAVRRAIPSHSHENNQFLFLLSRSLLALERSLGRKLTLSENMEAFDLWYQAVSKAGRLRPGQTREKYMSEFANARKCARVALGDNPVMQAWAKARSQPLPPEASIWESREKKLLVGLCWQLHLAADGQIWFLSCRDAAALLLPSDPKGFVETNRWLNELVGLGILEIAERGTAIRATRYWYLPQPLPARGDMQ
jgi:hypothetical protein